MKKYKLIKEYPGSPKIGTEATFRKDYNDYPCSDPFHQPLTRKSIEEFPEFWEEVKELEYEVLSYKYENRIFQLSTRKECRDQEDQKGIYYRCKDTSFINTASMHILNPNPIIHSIKRLSDGEVFTIGDKVQHKAGTDTGIINKITLEYGILLISYIGKYKNSEGWQFTNAIRVVNHLKQPLFTTKDGVEIYKGDKFYFVTIVDNKKPYRTSGIWEVCKPTIGFVYEPEYEKYFSTKEAAEEYVLMNKPCLSFNDVLKNVIIARGLDDLSQIKQLVKSKLNGK